ncbi:MAG: PIG-L family deacetylase [Gemmatimonadota bacterium]|nr:MAG: PIG-L family deacetylase [Gemmatimonadota bacterium]
MDPQQGVVGVARALRGLGSVKRVLVIGAHPDDEDTALLTWLVRGVGAKAAYLALNRGEGGQNLIGPELGVGLGLVRTGELVAARELDGADQFFTRAYDFGYSKSAEETFTFWPRDSLLADVVAVVRRFQPQIIVSIFSGTPRDGHGQHQVAGILAREAYEAAGDPQRFPGQLAEGLQPWTPLKLYRSARFDRTAATLEVETGALDPLYGRSYHQIAMASRSRHRSQDMGRIEALGPQRTAVRLLESKAPAESGTGETSLFDGVDTTLAGTLAVIRPGELRDELAASLGAYAQLLERARTASSGAQTAGVVPVLSEALSQLRSAADLAETGGPEAEQLRTTLGDQERQLGAALLAAAGVIVEVFTDDDLVVAGQSLEINVEIWNGGEGAAEVRRITLHSPAGTQGASPVSVPAATLTRQRFSVTIPAAAAPSQLYFLRAPLDRGFYSWPAASAERGTPLGRPVASVMIEVDVAGQTVTREVEAVYRFADQARGEVRRPLFVVPAVGVHLEPATTVWPLDRDGGASFTVRVRGEGPDGVNGRVRLEVPDGWSVAPAEADFALSAPGSAATVDFDVSIPAGVEPGPYFVSAVAETDDGRSYREGYSIIDYPHVRRSLWFSQARARVEAFELTVKRDLKVGYVPGAGDAVADAIAAMGVPVEVLDDRAVAAGDLAAYDVIVLGIRTYETNPTLLANNERFLDWARAGGTLISQYQQYTYFNGDYAPYPLRARRPHDRVSDELAPMTILVADHPVFNRPNRIGAHDFQGWVQERGLYFPYEWDARYQPLLESADPGEEPKRGGLLVAPLGDGLYVYTGLSLFRQLPAGVPGAYRLLANLLSLGG